LKLFKTKYVCYALGNTSSRYVPLNEMWKDNIIAKWYYFLGVKYKTEILHRSPVPMDVHFAIACTGFSEWKCPMIEKYKTKYKLEYPYRKK